MAASSNPTGNEQQQSAITMNGGVDVTSNGNANSGGPNENSGTNILGMKHNPGIATDWTSNEQTILENGLTQYASVPSIIRYAKIAMELPSKTARDVALRTRWMNKKEVSKRRKDDHERKSKDKREKVTESSSRSSQLHTSRPVGHPYPVPAVPLDEDDGISFNAIGGPTGELLTQNQQFFQQISSNFSSCQFQENIILFSQARDNLFKIMNACSVKCQ